MSRKEMRAMNGENSRLSLRQQIFTVIDQSKQRIKQAINHHWTSLRHSQLKILRIDKNMFDHFT